VGDSDKQNGLHIQLGGKLMLRYPGRNGQIYILTVVEHNGRAYIRSVEFWPAGTMEGEDTEDASMYDEFPTIAAANRYILGRAGVVL
jgi:predicted heme/steroid binding protein